MKDEVIQIIPLGGLGEVGMNMIVFCIGDEWFVVDAGVQFGDPTLIGAEKVLPDMDFLLENRSKIKAFVLTHGHEDHIGALQYVMDVCSAPVFGPPFAIAVIKEKAKEFGEITNLDLRGIPSDGILDLWGVKIEFIRVTHSIPDAYALCIHTPVGIIVHTGDFKIDPNPVDGRAFERERLMRLKDVRLLLSDSTNAEIEGHTRGERELFQTLRYIIGEARGRVIISLFASNIHRIRGIIDIAKDVGRRVALIGRSLHLYLSAAMDSGHGFLLPDLVDPEKIDDLPDHRLLIICTGSQAEPRSTLYRASNQDHQQLIIRKGDRVILSSRMIPGNERAILRMVNRLVALGAEVFHERNAPVHASGHAQRDELMEMMSLVRPRSFIPIHGEFVYLSSHAKIAKERQVEDVKIVGNGDVVEVSHDTVRVVDHISLNPYYCDGPTVGDADELRLSERKKLAWNGSVALHLKIKKARDRLAVLSDVKMAGVPDINNDIIDFVKMTISDAVSQLSVDVSKQDVETVVLGAVKSFFKHRLEKNPCVMPFIEFMNG